MEETARVSPVLHTETAGHALIPPRPRRRQAAMSTGLLFAIGTLVTALVAVGVALPIYGAILDGRYQAEHERAEVPQLSEKRSGHRSAA